MKRLYLATPAALVLVGGLLFALRTPAGSAEGAGSAVRKARRAPALTELVGTGTGTLKGKVVFVGPKPDLMKATADLQEQMKASADNATCFKGTAEEIVQQKWRMGPKGGVANVFVALKAPKGTFFKVDLAKKTWPAEVVIDQPHCAFLPHAAVLFPFYRRSAKDKELTPTGQKFVVKNSAPMTHNVFYTGGTENAGLNKPVLAGGQLPARPQPDAAADRVPLHHPPLDERPALAAGPPLRGRHRGRRQLRDQERPGRRQAAGVRLARGGRLAVAERLRGRRSGTDGGRQHQGLRGAGAESGLRHGCRTVTTPTPL
jgi:hypothetical protein